MSWPLSETDLSVEFESRQRKIVAATAVFADLNDPEESVAAKADFSVHFGVDSEGRCGALLTQLVLFFFVLHVLFMVPRLVNSPVECDPVSFIVTCLHVPVKHAVSA